MLAFIEVSHSECLIIGLDTITIEEMQQLEQKFNFERIIYKDKEVF